MAEYLKIPEVARRLDVSEKTARRYVKSGMLPSTFVGGAYRVSEEDLEKYLENSRVIAGGELGKAPAPVEAGPDREEPLEVLLDYRESLLDVNDELREEFAKRREAGDVDRLITLFKIAAWTSMGAAETIEDEEAMQERAGDSEDLDRARTKVFRALLMLDETTEAISETIDEALETESGVVVHLHEAMRKRKAS